MVSACPIFTYNPAGSLHFILPRLYCLRIGLCRLAACCVGGSNRNPVFGCSHRICIRRTKSDIRFRIDGGLDARGEVIRSFLLILVYHQRNPLRPYNLGRQCRSKSDREGQLVHEIAEKFFLRASNVVRLLHYCGLQMGLRRQC
jgi:hypothetical protein